MKEFIHDCTKIDMNLFGKVIDNKTYREFIQYLLLTNTKGDNGLFVKNLREVLSNDEEDFILEEIEFYNDRVEDRTIWDRSARDIYNDLDEKFKKEVSYNQSLRACYFLLFTLNYVFFCYANRSFRRFLGVQMRNFFNRYQK